MTTRRDSRGRRIGRNWWREWTVATWRDADDAWQLALEEASVGYATEAEEFRHNNPRPTLKATLIGLAQTQP